MFWPLSRGSRRSCKKEFQESGFWKTESGTLLIVDGEGTFIGDVEFEICYHCRPSISCWALRNASEAVRSPAMTDSTAKPTISPRSNP